MNRRLIGYWMATGLFCLAMSAGGTMNLLRAEVQRESMAALGYPEYLMTILGVAKILGVIALLIPGAALLKEWAYAGFFFDLTGAAYLHGIAGDYAGVATPLVFAVLLLASYALRPSTAERGAGIETSRPIAASLAA